MDNIEITQSGITKLLSELNMLNADKAPGPNFSIFTLGAPHEKVQGRQRKLHPGFALGKLVQASPGISILRDSHIVLSKRS